MRDWAVVTGATGPHIELLRYCAPTLERFADAHEMECLRRPVTNFSDSYPASWCKVPILREANESSGVDSASPGHLVLTADTTGLVEHIGDPLRVGLTRLTLRLPPTITTGERDCLTALTTLLQESRYHVLSARALLSLMDSRR